MVKYKIGRALPYNTRRVNYNTNPVVVIAEQKVWNAIQ